MRKIDIAIQQKQVKDKVTPKGIGKQFQFSLPSMDLVRISDKIKET
jgi:hypothetical protein